MGKEENQLDELPLPATATQRDDGKKGWRRGLCAARARVLTAHGAGIMPTNRISENSTEAASDGASMRQPRPHLETTPSGFIEKVVIDNDAPPNLWGPMGTAIDENSSSKPLAASVPEVPPPSTDITGGRSDASTILMKSSKRRFRKFTSYIRNVAWPDFRHFFISAYPDRAQEEIFQRELWWTSKRSHLYGALFFVVNWVIQVAITRDPSTWMKIVNWGLEPASVVPLPFLVIADWPRTHRRLWQTWVLVAVWVSSAGQLIDLGICDYYESGNRCHSRDGAISVFYYAVAPATVALFSMGQTRLSALISFVIWLIVIIITLATASSEFAKNIINLILFYTIILTIAYQRECTDRRLFSLRTELKSQYRAKQRAEVSERRMHESRQNFANYTFHEVRVPLNTALLAFQNLSQSFNFEKDSQSAEELAALEGSLQMMLQVLNDVLDFNKMAAGALAFVSRPFSFHAVLQSILQSFKIQTDERGLKLDASLDLAIDEVAKRVAYPELVADNLGPIRVGDGVVLGDELRVRQIINNLASNASKFTPTGGTVCLRTSLVYPTQQTSQSAERPEAGDEETDSDNTASSSDQSSATRYLATDQAHTDLIVIRIEIEDTGVGIRSSDLKENRLFSAFVQTEAGKKQGGKGTGLGLSLVRQIVLLSGGRLGVKSKASCGSTFWVELPFRVGPQTRETAEPHRRMDSPGSTLSQASGRTSGRQTSWSNASDYKWFPSPGRDRQASLSTALDRHTVVEVEELRPELITNSETSPVSSVAPGPCVPSTLTSPSILPSPISSSSGDSSSQGPQNHRENPQLSASSSLSCTTSSGSAQGTSPTNQGPESASIPLDVLVVDDDLLTRKLMSRLLTKLGCKVSTAENGQVALDEILPRTAGGDPPPFDIVFLDNQMPVMTGLQVVSKLKELGRSDLVIGVTANAMTDDQAEFVQCGAHSVLTKPVLQADLSRCLVLANERRSGPTSTTSQLPDTPPPAHLS